VTRREAPKTTLVVGFPPDGKADWYVSNPDITFEVANPISSSAQYRTLYRWDGSGEEIEWDGSAIKVPSDGQHILEYRSVIVLTDDFAVTPGKTLVTVPRYFSELPKRYLFKLDTTQPKVGSGLTDLFDSRVLITDDFFLNDGSAVLTSVMPGKASGWVFVREPSVDPPAHSPPVLEPDADGEYTLEISAPRPVPGTLVLRPSAETTPPLVEHVDYKADYYEASGKVFVESLPGGSWPIGVELLWEIGVRDVVRYENRDGRQRFIVRFPTQLRTLAINTPQEGEVLDTGLLETELASLLLDVVLVDDNGIGRPASPATFELVAESDGRVFLRNNSAGDFSPGLVRNLRVRGVQSTIALERVGFSDDGSAFVLDEGTGKVYVQPAFSLLFDSASQLLSIRRSDTSMPYDSDLVLELKLEARSENAKYIDFSTYNDPSATRHFTIDKEQSVWYYSRDECGKPTEDSVANVVVNEIESGIDRVYYTFNNGTPTEQDEYIESPSAVLPAPPSYRNRFVFKWLAVDRAGNSDSGFFTNVGDALTAPLVLPDSFLAKPIERIHFAPDGETLDETSPSVSQSGDFIVIEKGVCRGCVDVNFLVVYSDQTSATGSTGVCVYNDFLIGSFVPQIVSEFGPGETDSQARQWYRGFRPIVVLPIFGPRPADLAPDTPFPSKIFWKWSDEDTYREYTEPFMFRDVGENVLNLYVSFIDADGNGTESDSFRFTYYWDNERPAVSDNSEEKWLNRDATIFFTFAEEGSGVKALYYRVWKETLDAPPGQTPDAQGLVDLNDVVAFFVARDPETLADLQPQDLTDEQVNEYLRLQYLPPVESMDEWALSGGVENPDVKVEDQRIVDGEVFTGINARIRPCSPGESDSTECFLPAAADCRLRRMDLEKSPFIRLCDPGRYHIAVFAVDNANNVSADDVGVSSESLRPVFTEHVVQIDQTPPVATLAFDRPSVTTELADGTQLIELGSYPDIDLIAVDLESGVEASFYRFGGRNRLVEETVLPEVAISCEPSKEEIPGTGEFVRFGGVIRLDASGPEFEDDIFFFATDKAGNRSKIQKATIRVRISDDEADVLPPTIRDIVPKSGKIDVSRNAHIQFFVQDDDSGVDIDSVVVSVNGVEFRLDSRPAIQLRYTPPAERNDIEYLYATVVNNNLILRDNFGVHEFLDGTVLQAARLSFDDDDYNTVEEVIDFLNRVPGLTASLSATSLATLDSKLLRDVRDVKVFDRSDPAVGTLTQVTLLSLLEETPQFAYFERSKGYVIDINPRALFDSRGDVVVQVDAKDRVGNAMDTLSMTFRAQQMRTLPAEDRNDMVRRSKRFTNRLHDNTASNYRKNWFTNTAGFLKACAQEYASLERAAVKALANGRFDTVEASHLYRNFGSLMGVPGTRFISHQEYHQLLFSLRNANLEGSNPITFREALAAWAPGGVEVTDLVNFSADIADQHKIRVAIFFDEETRRHAVTHPDPLKSGIYEFVRDFRPAHLYYGEPVFAFGEQFDFQAGCEPVCVTAEGFHATRLIVEPAAVKVTVSGEADDATLDRLRAIGLEVCRVSEPIVEAGSALCPDDVTDTRTVVRGFAQRSRFDAIGNDPSVLDVSAEATACRCVEECDGDCPHGVPAELSEVVSCCSDGSQPQVLWGSVGSIDDSSMEFTIKLRQSAAGGTGLIDAGSHPPEYIDVRVFTEEGRHSVARRTYHSPEGCDRLASYECADFTDIQPGDCVVAMGAFIGRTPVFKDGPWFNLWLTPETYATIRDCDPSLPEDIATFDEDGNISGGYVGLDSSGLPRTPPYTDYQRSVTLSGELEKEPSQRSLLVPGHTSFREIVATLEACPESGCELLVKNSPTAICECLLAGLQLQFCENTRKDSGAVEGVARAWRTDVSDQWDGSGVYAVRAPMLSPSEFPGDLRLASAPQDVLAYVDCELADIASFDAVRGTVCLRDVPQQDQRVVVLYYGNEHASVESDKYHFTVHDDGSMDLMDRSKLGDDRFRVGLDGDGKLSTPESGRNVQALMKQHIPRDACETLAAVNERNEDFSVTSCLVEPNQLQPPEQCLDVEPFAEHGYNDTRLEPHRLNEDFLLNAFPGLRKASPLHAPVSDHMPSACLEFGEIRLRRSWNDTKSATNDPGQRRREVDFLDGPKLPDREIDYTEVCACDQYYYNGSYGHTYGSLLDETLRRRRQRFGFVDHDTSVIHYAVDEAVIPVPGFVCYGYETETYGYVYFPYYHYLGCREAVESDDGPTTSGGCPTVFERNPWIDSLFDLREEPFWAVEGEAEPFPIGVPIG